VAVSNPEMSADRLSLTEVRDGAVLTIGVSGEVDLENAQQFDAFLRAAAGSDASRIVLDLRDLGFIDSTGLKAVMEAADVMGDRLGVYRGTGGPAKVLKITAIDRSLNLLD
jgi:anti-anti-sigma factor